MHEALNCHLEEATPVNVSQCLDLVGSGVVPEVLSDYGAHLLDVDTRESGREEQCRMRRLVFHGIRGDAALLPQDGPEHPIDAHVHGLVQMKPAHRVEQVHLLRAHEGQN